MPRELRPRKPRLSYADHENIAGPSSVPLVDEDNDSGSEFEPDKAPKRSKNPAPFGNEDEDADTNDAQSPSSEADETLEQGQGRTTASQATSKLRGPIADTTGLGSSRASQRTQKRKLPPRVQQATRPPSMSTPPLSTRRAAKMYALPNPSAHHRHRAIPVFLRKGMVERLDEPPLLFKDPRIVPTNSMTADRSLTDRVSKAWGFNVGAGPVWQIMEDRSCYKESSGSGPGSEKESLRRPRVYENLSVRPGWELLSNQCVANG